ncbi:MAG TPA: DUF2795 domain-containing protein [Actinomycetota bacterium]|nr:DUF2795 domain-containing protein [Actinomycetota bacterium]
MEAARRQGAPAPLIDRLSRLPDDTVFENVQTVWEEARLR